MQETVICRGKVTNLVKLEKKLLDVSKHEHGIHYRVDVLMDKLDHGGRTLLAKEEFPTLQATINYAMNRTSSNKYQIVRRSVLRDDNTEFVSYNLCFM